MSFLRVCDQYISGNVDRIWEPTHLAPSTPQDHLYSGWFASKHLKEIEKYREGVRDASMHAPWKDSTWMEQLDEGEPSSKCGPLHSNLRTFHSLTRIQSGPYLLGRSHHCG